MEFLFLLIGGSVSYMGELKRFTYFSHCWHWELYW